MSRFIVPEEEYLLPGHRACAGCGPALALRHVLKVLGKNTILVIPAGCWAVLAGIYPKTMFKVAIYLTTFASAAAEACAIRHALDLGGKKNTHVVVWAGDGATYDIGLSALSAAAARNENIIYICNDNEAYMNTGNQCSSATPLGAWSTTTPEGGLKATSKKDIVEIIMAHHEVPYIATCAIGNYRMLRDFYGKIEKAAQITGFRFIHILGPCVPGWRYQSSKTVEIARLAVESCYFPLLEILDGKCALSYVPRKKVPLVKFLEQQGRFEFMKDEDIKKLQEEIDIKWEKFLETMPRYKTRTNDK